MPNPWTSLSQAKKRYLLRLGGYAINPVQRRWRVFRGAEQTMQVEGLSLHLPPEHDLPFFQRRDPTYDAYATDLIRRLVSGSSSPAVIDVGANVGDTAVAVLAADARIRVLAVEGSPRFLPYLERNLSPHADRASWRIGFVGPVGDRVRYTSFGSTGGFRASSFPTSDSGQDSVTQWITPRELIGDVGETDFLVFKTDIDGFDIHVLAEHWADIDAASDVIWFEYDPARTLGDPVDIERLHQALAASGRRLLVYDNLGRRMFTIEGALAPEVLGGMSRWLAEGLRSHFTIPYLDIWAIRPDHRVDATTAGETEEQESPADGPADELPDPGI